MRMHYVLNSDRRMNGHCIVEAKWDPNKQNTHMWGQTHTHRPTQCRQKTTRVEVNKFAQNDGGIHMQVIPALLYSLTLPPTIL